MDGVFVTYPCIESTNVLSFDWGAVNAQTPQLGTKAVRVLLRKKWNMNRWEDFRLVLMYKGCSKIVCAVNV